MLLQNLKNKIRLISGCAFLNKSYLWFNKAADFLIRYRIFADRLTFAGIIFAILGLNFLALSQYFFALICLIGNRLCDILDGIIARKTKITRFGIFLDIFADYTAAALFIWGFVLASPSENGASGTFLLLALLVSSTALLAFSSISKINYRNLNQSQYKICAWGIVQNFDHFTALFVMCLFPNYFIALSIFFGIIILGKSALILSGAYYTLVIAPKNRKNYEID